MARRRAALAALVLGLGIATAAQVTAPLATPPLYDGVVVVEPYVYVNPPNGQPGGAQGNSAHLPMKGHVSPVVVLATPEQPPQAQIVAQAGGLTVPSSATALDVTLAPLDPSVDAAAAASARVLGNVYRITIVDQDGAAATAPLSALVTVVLRAPEDVSGAKVGQLVGEAWHPLKSEPGFGSTYVAVVTSFGDFAVVAPVEPSAATTGPTEPATGSGAGAGAGSDGSPSPRTVGAVVVIALLAFIVGAAMVTSRRGRHRRNRP
jgi:hypothetical protein